LKKLVNSARFPFYKSKTEKNKKKTSQTGFYPKNRTKSKPVGLNRFQFFFKSVWLLFLIKTEPNRKKSPHRKFQQAINPVTSGGSSPECLNLAG
jgi:hypothetical protein